MADITIRPLHVNDSIDEITALLHRAYSRNAAADLRFVATSQTPSVTAERLSQGKPFVAVDGDKIVGIVTLRFPSKRPYGDYNPGHDFASLAQFAVDPSHSGQRIGDRLLDEVERQAICFGAVELALDTAQPATGLILYYERRGFRIVGRDDLRPVTNYESWIMSKRLQKS